MSRITVPGVIVWLLMPAIGSVACGRDAQQAVDPDHLRRLVDRPAVLDEAENRLIARCMNQEGMTYPQVPVPPDDRPTIGLLRGPAPLHADIAREHGYPDGWMTDAPNPKKGPVETPADSLPPELGERFRRLLRGEGRNDVRVLLPGNFEVAAASSGCVGDARRRLYGSVENYLTVFYLPELVQRRSSAADEDPDVRGAYAAFARCMAGEGYHTATPAAAVALARTYYPDGRRPRSGAEETKLALADAQCRTAVRLRERRAAAVDRLVRRWPADNAAAVSKAHGLLQAALAAAKATTDRR